MVGGRFDPFSDDDDEDDEAGVLDEEMAGCTVREQAENKDYGLQTTRTGTPKSPLKYSINATSIRFVRDPLTDEKIGSADRLRVAAASSNSQARDIATQKFPKRSEAPSAVSTLRPTSDISGGSCAKIWGLGELLISFGGLEVSAVGGSDFV